MHPMRSVRLDKVVLNVGVGEGGEKLLKAQRVLQLLTRQKPTPTLARRSVRDWGVKQNQPIGCKVTLRGEAAAGVLKRAFEARGNRLPVYSFDLEGNFSFGIADYTDFEGMRYDPEIGIFGLDVTVTLARPGRRVAVRRLASRRLPRKQRVSPEDAIAFVQERFGVEVVEA